MRHFFKAALLLIALILSGCSGYNSKVISFIYDSNFGRIARFSPVLFTGDENLPLFPELKRIAKEVGLSIRCLEIDEMNENFLSKFKAALPSNVDKPVIITSHLYSYADIVALLKGRNIAVVGPTLDIDTDAVKIVGGGFDAVRGEGASLASFENSISYIMPDNKFQEMIKDLFVEGAGDKTVSVFPVKMDAMELNSQSIVSVSDMHGLVIAAYGRYFKHISGSKVRSGKIHVINYPGKPEFMESGAKKKTEKVLYYDFTQSFKTALSNIGEKGVLYSFELIRQ